LSKSNIFYNIEKLSKCKYQKWSCNFYLNLYELQVITKRWIRVKFATSCCSLGQLISLLLWERKELKILTFDFFFCRNFYLIISNIKYKIIFDICTLKAFQWYKEHLIWIKLISCIFFTNIQEVAPREKLLSNLIPLSL